MFLPIQIKFSVFNLHLFVVCKCFQFRLVLKYAVCRQGWFKLPYKHFQTLSNFTLSKTSPDFYVSAVQVFWKHCGNRRNCSFLPVWRSFCHFHQIWKCLKFVVWERVNRNDSNSLWKCRKPGYQHFLCFP